MLYDHLNNVVKNVLFEKNSCHITKYLSFIVLFVDINIMSNTSPCATQMGSTTKRSTTKKNLIKKPRTVKNKKKLFPELSFVEDHQETFYVGLNENVLGAFNPVTAKIVDPSAAEDLVKGWVNMK